MHADKAAGIHGIPGRAGAHWKRILTAWKDKPEQGRRLSSIYQEELRALGIKVDIPQREDTTVDYEMVDKLAAPLVALCLSGGGIRSASFGLGVLQGFARFGLLGEFHYLSTVSGGGYIGSFLTAWRFHEKKGDEEVFRKLNRPAHENGEESAEVRSIRAFSNYLTPRVGLFSADSWTVIAIIVRNLLLNWTIFLPFFMAALLVPRFCRDFLHAFTDPPVEHAPYLTLAAVVASAIGLSFASYGRRRSQAKWLTNGRFRQLVILPLVISSALLTLRTGVLLRANPGTYVFGTEFPGRLGAVLGGVSYVAAWLAASAALWKWPNPQGVRQTKYYDPALDVLTWGISGALVGYLIVLGMSLAPVLLRGEATPDQPVAPFLVVAGISWTMLSVLVGELLFVGLRSYSPRGDTDREWLARSAGWLAVVAASWSVFSAIGLYGPRALENGLRLTLGTAGVSGVISLALGNSAKTAAQAAQLLGKRFSVTQIVSFAAVIFAITLAILVSWIDDQMIRQVRDWLAGEGWPKETYRRWHLDGVGIVLLGLASVIVSIFINVNRFSLHALYRNRLVRAFLGSARAGLYKPGNAESERAEHLDPFTEFAQTDNVRMKDMPTGRLLHVINLTLNVVSTGNLAWQQRKAEPFTVTPLSCGNPNVQYCLTASYANPHIGITLGTAMAISGAAVSPNMGAHSSPLVGFLLTLFNLRLGWWLGNPKFAEASASGPRIGLLPLLQELAGQTTDRRRWVYLSDGGHFDNLGLYEMVRRRCRVIVVSDAGCDPTFSLSDLGDCLRKIYIDQGVSIDFRDFDIKARQTPPVSGPYSAIADISYPGHGPKGWLLYIKPGYHGSERADVRSYAEAHGAFPHESTSEQWFNESQLESYRALGAHITEMLCNNGKPLLPADMPAALDVAGLKASAEAASRPGLGKQGCGL